MSSLQPIKLYGLGRTANPLKVGIFLEELGIPFDVVTVAHEDVKGPVYTAINPNGRLPAIIDPNTNLTLWESGAIVEYLIETYDKNRKLSFAPDTPEFWHARQWLYFQTTGQGPYYGQLAWFKVFEKTPTPNAVERYAKEAERVTGVLEGWLEKQAKENPGTDGPWLVGGKLSYADIAFIPWQHVMAVAMKEDYDQSKFPHVQKWFDAIVGRPAVQSVLKRAAQYGSH
jgi:glutathione S-transferase